MAKRLFASFVKSILIFFVSGLTIISENGIIYFNSTSAEVPITCKFTEMIQESTAIFSEDNAVQLTIFTASCLIVTNPSGATIQCDEEKREYTAFIPMSSIVEGRTWQCQGYAGKTVISQSVKVLSIVPLTSAIITQAENSDVVNIVSGETFEFTCTTDLSRPPAWIQWYIGKRNITNDAVPKPPIPDGINFISTSKLIYTGSESDYNTRVYCEASNVEGWQGFKSMQIRLYILLPVTRVILLPTGDKNEVSVVKGEIQEFTCTTDASRPASWIQWYVGTRNVTDDAVSPLPQIDDTKFISSSSLKYKGKEADHQQVIYCVAGNIEGKQMVKTSEKTLNIGFLPDPVVDVKIVCDVAGLFATCMWRSEYNGGSEQLFRVVWRNLQSDILSYSENVPDPGIGCIVHLSTDALSYNSYYAIYIESTNAHGTVRSNEQIYCNTSDTVLPVTSSKLSFSAGLGSGAALIVSLNMVVIIVVLITKRRRRALAGRSNVYEGTKHEKRDTNVYNELNDLPRGSQNPTDSCDRTYEDISSGTNTTSKSDNKRKKSGKKAIS